MRELRLEYASAADLERDHASNLRKGRAFVAGAAGGPEREIVKLVLVHPVTHALWAAEAECVYAKLDDPGRGVGVQLRELGDAARATLEAFVVSGAGAPEEPEQQVDEDEDPAGRAVPRNVHERVRQLSLREREQMARSGSMPERVALERAFGSSVWEGLLQNPQLTPPEVARIAKNGVLPRPLVQVIVSHAAWVAVPEVQRALLGNPRVSGPAMERVLRAMARADLLRVASLSIYRQEVRSAAKRLLGG